MAVERTTGVLVHLSESTALEQQLGTGCGGTGGLVPRLAGAAGARRSVTS